MQWHLLERTQVLREHGLGLARRRVHLAVAEVRDDPVRRGRARLGRPGFFFFFLRSRVERGGPLAVEQLVREAVAPAARADLGEEERGAFCDAG